MWQSGHASVPSGSQWLHAGQLWITSGGAGAGGNTVAAGLVITLHLIGLRRQPNDPITSNTVYFLFPISYFLLPTSYSLFPTPYSLLPIPYSLPHPKYLNQHFTPC